MDRFGVKIRRFANHFQNMQTKRNECDYSPTYQAIASSAQVDLDATRTAINDFHKIEKKHKRAFAIYVLLKTRGEKKKRDPSKKAASGKKTKGATRSRQSRQAPELKTPP